MWLSLAWFATAELCHDPWLAIADEPDEKHHSAISQGEALVFVSVAASPSV